MNWETAGYIFLAASIAAVALAFLIRALLKAFRRYVRDLWPH